VPGLAARDADWIGSLEFSPKIVLFLHSLGDFDVTVARIKIKFISQSQSAPWALDSKTQLSNWHPAWKPKSHLTEFLILSASQLYASWILLQPSPSPQMANPVF
jgi:hypothetical protein